MNLHSHPGSHRRLRIPHGLPASVRIGLASTLAAGSIVAAIAAPVAAVTAPVPTTVLAGVGEAGTLGMCADAWVAVRTGPSIATWKKVGDCEIDRRLVTLGRLTTAIDGARRLTDAHHDTLAATISSTSSGLKRLRAEIDGDTTAASLRDDLGRIATDFRVYLVVARQVWLVVAADAGDAAVTAFGPATTRLQTAIDTAKAAGKDVSAAQSDLSAMTGHVADASKALDGTAAAVLAVTPASWNAGTGKAALRGARSDIADAAHDLRAAVASARAVLADLRAA